MTRSNSEMPGEQWVKVREYLFSRRLAVIYGVAVGILIGIGNSFLDVNFTLQPTFFGWLGAAILTVLFLHEGVHGVVGVLLGYRPILGVEPPLVYTTFKERIPRNHLMTIALAPLLVLDAAFIGLYLLGILKLFMDLCFAVNTIGAVGDMWIALKLLRHDAGMFVQDTKTGIEVWRLEAPRPPSNS
ncbi:MAG: hypothetical protein GTO22_27650 [Gemmatimonadales bacterium]|nr:hypothetical protein [Gemmatimonadales bacterium]